MQLALERRCAVCCESGPVGIWSIVRKFRKNPRDLPLYALYSLVRISVAYALSLVFALAYGYVAAVRGAPKFFMVPLLDILQSIPCSVFCRASCWRWWRFSAQPVWSGARFHFADLYGTSMEHRVQFLFFAEDGASRTA